MPGPVSVSTLITLSRAAETLQLQLISEGRRADPVLLASVLQSHYSRAKEAEDHGCLPDINQTCPSQDVPKQKDVRAASSWPSICSMRLHSARSVHPQEDARYDRSVSHRLVMGLGVDPANRILQVVE